MIKIFAILAAMVLPIRPKFGPDTCISFDQFKERNNIDEKEVFPEKGTLHARGLWGNIERYSFKDTKNEVKTFAFKSSGGSNEEQI